MESLNISILLDEWKEKLPNEIAVVDPSKKNNPSLTFLKLHEKMNQYAQAFIELGIVPGMKVLTFVKPSVDFPAVTFALFKIGAIPVMIDPGMGVKNLLKCISQVKPRAMVGIPATHILRRVYKSYFKDIDIFISTGITFGITKNLTKISKDKAVNFKGLDNKSSDTAAILFTSGGTGLPKGVVYTHGIFYHQTMMLKDLFKLAPGEVDLPGFPLFALFTIALGMKCVIPDMNPSKPASACPKTLVKNIIEGGVTFAAGSPAIWNKVADYCIDQNIKLPALKYVVMFGAPVAVSIHEKFDKILEVGTTYTPYGATECLPISCVSGKYVLSTTAKKTIKGAGVCVGAPAKNVKLYIISITEDKLPEWSDVNTLAPYEIGEIVVKSPTVTPCYYEMQEKTEFAKIYDGSTIYHRMGDVGYLDEDGRLWFCGRKDHRVDLKNETKYSIPCESIFNIHPDINKTALIRLKKNNEFVAGLIIERNDKKISLNTQDEIEFKKQLIALAHSNNKTSDIKDFFYHDNFPVDVRHNIKIDRLKLRDWAQEMSI